MAASDLAVAMSDARARLTEELVASVAGHKVRRVPGSRGPVARAQTATTPTALLLSARSPPPPQKSLSFLAQPSHTPACYTTTTLLVPLARARTRSDCLFHFFYLRQDPHSSDDDGATTSGAPSRPPPALAGRTNISKTLSTVKAPRWA